MKNPLTAFLFGGLKIRKDRFTRRTKRHIPRIESLESRQLLATFTVSTMADSGAGSLRQAIISANSSAGADVIVFAASTGGTELDLITGEMAITESLTITGNGAGQMIIDAHQASRIFSISNAAVNVTIERLTLRNGRQEGDNGGTILTSGGAIHSRLTGTLTIRSSTLSGNSTNGSYAMGGAVYARGGAVTVSGSTFSGNATLGSRSDGGAIYAADNDVTVSESDFVGNFTSAEGSSGGAIGADSGSVTLRLSRLTENFTEGRRSNGGALSGIHTDWTVSRSLLSGNSVRGQFAIGGAFFAAYGTLTISQSTLSGNSATGDSSNGGAFGLTSNRSVNISQSTLTLNRAAQGAGGAIFGFEVPYAEDHPLKLQVENSIVAGNVDNGTAPDLQMPPGTFNTISVTYSLIGRNNGTRLQPSVSPDSQGNLIGGNTAASAMNPLLSPLAHNGGPTLTHALLLNSPAFNRGSNAQAVDVAQPGTVKPALATDQRATGFARKRFGIVDMGALESSVPEIRGGSAGNDDFVLTYSGTSPGGTVSITVSTSGGPAVNAGTFPMSLPVSIDGRGGNDSIRLVGTSGSDTFTVTGNGVTINGASLAMKNIERRTLAGAAGNDIYKFDADDVLAVWSLEESGVGTDTLDFSLSSSSVEVFLGTTARQIINDNLSLTLNSPTAFENASGGSWDDTLIGGVGANFLIGNGGNDIFYGGLGSDTLVGGLGHDIYSFSPATAGLELDTVTEHTAAGSDTLRFSSITSGVIVNLSLITSQNVHTNRKLRLSSRSTIESATGGSGHDTLAGNALGNTLIGNGGNDVFYGGLGSDLLLGGAGDDVYHFSPATLGLEDDRVTELAGGGTDTLNFASLTTNVIVSLASTEEQSIHANRTLKLNLNNTFENVIGGSGNDRLAGNTLANVLVGNAGTDTLFGGAGRDLLIGGLGLDTLYGSEDDDIVISGRTTHDSSIGRLNTLHGQWISTSSYAVRVSRLRTGIGSSAVSLKTKFSVLNDSGEKDIISGGPGTDWYFRALNDVITGLVSGETVESLYSSHDGFFGDERNSQLVHAA